MEKRNQSDKDGGLNQTILGIDIGSTKICAIIAEMKDGKPHIIGTGIHKSQGLKRGAINNIDLASRAVRNAVSDAKRIAGTMTSKAIVSISSVYVQGVNSSGIINVPQSEIGFKDIRNVVETALYVAKIPNDYQVLHVLPYNFKVDDQDFIDDPLGMSGSRLEVSVHIITAQRASIENLRKVINNAGVEIENIVLGSYASSIAVLNYDEKELGVACVDMGGAMCDIVIHIGNSIKYDNYLKLGSSNITNDLSVALQTPQGAAEEVKVKYGSLSKVQSGDIIEVPVVGDETKTRRVSLDVVQKVMSCRVEETLELLAQSINASMLQGHLGAGIVLTGGMVKLDGLRELTSAVFPHMPIRIASPVEIDGLFENLRDPSYSTAIGLILYGAGFFTNYEMDSERKIRHKGEDKPYADNGNLISALSLHQESRETNKVPSTAPIPVAKSPAEVKNDLSEIATVGGNRGGSDNVMSRIWRSLTQLF